MALTEQQKAENKAAQLVRNRAHAARRELLEQAVEAAKNLPEVASARAALDLASANAEAFRIQQDSEIAALETQIAELQAQIERLKTSSKREELRSQRRAMVDEWRRIEGAMVDAAEARFPDLQGESRFSAACWEPPHEVVAEMERARSQASPKAKG